MSTQPDPELDNLDNLLSYLKSEPRGFHFKEVKETPFWVSFQTIIWA